MTRDNKGNDDTSVFRGRSMQDAIGQLKLELGPDAVIVGTTRGSDRQALVRRNHGNSTSTAIVLHHP